MTHSATALSKHCFWVSYTMTSTVAKLMTHSIIIWSAQSEALQPTTSQLTNLSASHGSEYSSDICRLQGGPLPEFVDYLRSYVDSDACGSCKGVCGYVAGKYILYSSTHQANGRAVPSFDWHNSCSMERSLNP